MHYSSKPGPTSDFDIAHKWAFVTDPSQKGHLVCQMCITLAILVTQNGIFQQVPDDSI